MSKASAARWWRWRTHRSCMRALAQLRDRKSTRLNSSHSQISYAVFCLKKKKVLTADLSEVQSIRDSLHNVDRILIGNQSMVKDALLSFETYTGSLASKSELI